MVKFHFWYSAKLSSASNHLPLSRNSNITLIMTTFVNGVGNSGGSNFLAYFLYFPYPFLLAPLAFSCLFGLPPLPLGTLLSLLFELQFLGHAPHLLKLLGSRACEIRSMGLSSLVTNIHYGEWLSRTNIHMGEWLS